MVSVESTAAPAIPVEKRAGPSGFDAAFEERWALWRARGVAHDRAFRRRFMLGLPIVAAAIASAVFLMW
jgi:hypothetical protein